MKTHWNIHSFLSGTHCYFLWIAAGLIAIHLAYGAERILPVFPYEGNFSESFTVGETWIYEHHGVRSSGNIGQPVNGDRVEEVVSKQTADDRELWIVKMKWGVDDFEPIRTFLDARRFIHRIEHGAFTADMKPSCPYEMIDLKPGELREYTAEQVSENLVIPIQVKAERLIDETVETPAGIFQDCQKVKVVLTCEFPDRKAPIKLNYMLWYHPKVNGMIKESFLFIPSPEDGNTLEKLQGVSLLKSYTVQRKES